MYSLGCELGSCAKCLGPDPRKVIKNRTPTEALCSLYQKRRWSSQMRHCFCRRSPNPTQHTHRTQGMEGSFPQVIPSTLWGTQCREGQRSDPAGARRAPGQSSEQPGRPGGSEMEHSCVDSGTAPCCP